MSDLLSRVERRALILTAATTVLASVVPGGGVNAAVAVLGGALLAAVSYWAIKHGVTGIADAVLRQRSQTPPEKARRPRGIVMFVLRYTLLAGLAYVMIARLRLSPIWLLSGASVMAVAAAIELLRHVRPRI